MGPAAPAPEAARPDEAAAAARVARARTIQDCLEARLTIARVALEGEFGAAQTLGFDLANGLDWPIAGLWFGFSVHAAGEDLPWFADDMVQAIPGGVPPGERRRVETVLHLPPDTPPDARIALRVLNVADAERRFLVPGGAVSGWSEALSEESCAPPPGP